MSDSNLTQQDVKSFLNDGVGLAGASAEDAMSYFQNNYGDLKGLEAYKLFNQAKVGIASTGLSWDSNKTTGQNIAYLTADNLATAAITAGVVVASPIELPAIALFTIGLLGNEALKSIDIDIAQMTQNTYDYANLILDINEIETANFYKLPESAQVQMTQEGKFPGGPNWNEFLNEMSDYYTTQFEHNLNDLIPPSDDNLPEPEPEPIPDPTPQPDPDPDPLNPPPPKDPLVLDTDKDGFISTIALSDSNTYFDITGDGIKERVSWIAPNDGILVYDKNESGKIDGIDEVFGNFTKNGFEELKELIDSNNDGKIDRQDELFNRLEIWNDTNGDGTTQTNELSTLKDAGVKSINLNYVSTNITLGGATLTEASKYTDAKNNKELVADVNLEYNPILTTVDTSTIPDYTVDPDTLFLPNLRGYGLIMDSFISYNTNDALKEKALELQAEFMNHFTCQEQSWHVQMNNRDFKLEREVA